MKNGIVVVVRKSPRAQEEFDDGERIFGGKLKDIGSLGTDTVHKKGGIVATQVSDGVKKKSGKKQWK